jgi:RimJ/RimL family protein N-acetyltransferase
MGALLKAMDPPVPPEVIKAADGLTYRDFITVALVLPQEYSFPDNWIYIHDPGVKLGRVQNFKNWSPDLVPDPSKSSLGLEYFCFEGDGLWDAADEDLLALGRRHRQGHVLHGRTRIEIAEVIGGGLGFLGEQVVQHVDHHGDRFYLRINDTGRNFRLVSAPIAHLKPEHWQEIVPHRTDVMLEDIDLFQRYRVLHERDKGLGQLVITALDSGDTHRIAFDEPAYSLSGEANPEWDRPIGLARLFNIHLLEGYAFLEVMLTAPKAIRRGFGVEAGKLISYYGVDVLGLRRIEAKVYEYNRLSANSLRRNGFRQEGILRQAGYQDGQCWDMLVFGILKHEIELQRKKDPVYLPLEGAEGDTRDAS